MNIDVQYYRAPFPEERYWEQDFTRTKETGLNAMQLWVLWAWVEPKPSEFVFNDYNRLVHLAEEERTRRRTQHHRRDSVF